MANLVSIATGNFATAGTWALVDAASYANSETTGATPPTSSGATSRSAAFTPAASTITAIAVKLRTRTGTVGTVTVALILSSDNSVQKTTTINMADLQAAATVPLDGGWVVFKFASGLAVNGSTAYKVDVITSVSTQISLFVGSGNDWSRMLLTSTTQAPVAGDDLCVLGEYTGAGTSNSFTVTNDTTAATDFGSNTTTPVTPALAVGAKGTLKWKDTSAANPYLRLSGHAIVYNGGELDIGTSGTPIPRDSVAVLEFDCLADGDFGLLARNGSILNCYGLSRTVAKSVVACKVNTDYASGLLTSAGLNLQTASTVTFNNALEPTGFSRLATTLNDTAANSIHTANVASTGTVTNTTQVFSIWLARGSGTNNRYARISLANTGSAAITNGFYADVDLQAGTIGTCTAVGTGTATSSAITALGTGFICTIIGKVASGSSASIPAVWCCNASGVTSYAGDASQNLIFYGPQVFTASALPSAAVTVDTDTGWLTGDLIALASTSRTVGDCESGLLASGAGATSITLNEVPFAAHSGTSPTQAEVINLTRNVKIRAVTQTFMTWLFSDNTAVTTIQWTEFYYVGVNTAAKRGIEAQPTTGSFSMTFSSIHDTEVNGLYLTGATLNNVTFSSNVMWNLSTTTGPGCQISAATTGTAITIDSNVSIKPGATIGWALTDLGGTFTNNTVVSAVTTGIAFQDTGSIGTCSGNVAHSNNGAGTTMSAQGMTGTVTSLTSWRNAGSGITFSSPVADFALVSPVLFGNTTDNIQIASSCSFSMTGTPVLSGDTTFATTNGIRIISANGIINLLMDNADFSTVAGIKTAHTNDINLAAVCDLRAILRNCKLGAATEVLASGSLTATGYISSEKHDQTAGLHKTWTKYGALTGGLIIDSVIYHNATPSQKCIPNTSTAKLESAVPEKGVKVAVANGATVTPSVYARKSVVGDAGGVAYVGNQPRLILRANPAIGIAADVVIATMTVANNSGTWEQLTGATAAATDDGAMEFVVDCDGTSSAWINVDDWSA